MKRISGNADDIKDKKDRVKKDGYNRGAALYLLPYLSYDFRHALSKTGN